MTMKVVAVGDNCIDFYNILNKGYPGGNAVNFAVYMQKLGIASSYVGVVGNDDNGDIIIDSMKNQGVNISRVHRKEGRTAITQVELINNDRILGEYDEGVFKEFTLSEEDISYIQKHDLIHSAIWGKVDKYFHKFGGMITSFDYADKLDSQIVEDSLPFVDYAFFSYQRHDEYIRDYIQKVKSKGPKVVVATLNRNGSIAYDGNKMYYIPSIPTKVIDTLGAGDSFIAGFMYGILKDNSIEECLKIGTEYASKTITYFGAW
ncbi:fructoselysine 6-kinase [Alkaliphilus peptidifermentans]|uniref:Fructoselysine 6-kinase n=1 Tax=Alkaliphilus peptidifermentans DSM 18978 TaxID=1120976 RepID=A0A1G5KRF3_9FIRM|nr:fructoselysine 6-kinase [Alkaliphilus peptidifermentans]SCZ03185.1 fructoselysine 6-kinase [Alkaliphilus peptidifermentans DSM 18978]